MPGRAALRQALVLPGRLEGRFWRLTGHCVLPRGLGASGSLNVILPTLLAGAEFCGPAQSYRSRDNPNLKHRFDSSLALVHLFEKPGPRLSSLWARWRADNLSA